MTDTIAIAPNVCEKRNERMGIVVGVNKYLNLSPLRYAVSDATLVGSILENRGMFRVDLYTDDTAVQPTRRNILKALQYANELAANKTIKTFLFHFSGHGFHNTGKNYLALIDTDDELLQHTGIDLDAVLNLISSIRMYAKTIVFLDSCRTRPGERGGNSWTALPKNSSGLGVFFGTSQGAPAFENDKLKHGVFSYHLAQGLLGEADHPPYGSRDGYVSFRELVTYVQAKMSGSAQLPTATCIEQYGDFVLTKSDIRIVSFPDKKLARIIRAITGTRKGNVTTDQLAGVTELNLWHKEISDFTGLEACVNLRVLESTGITRIIATITGTLDRSVPTNITPLSRLSCLEVLYLPQNALVDISPLAGLKTLRKLILAQNRLKDVSSIHRLDALELLGLSDNQIHDVRPLRRLVNLQELALSDNAINDIHPLTRLSKLEDLAIASNVVRDVSPLAKLKRLRKLDLSNNNVVDLSPLANLQNLEKLDVSSNQVITLAPLSALTKLIKLYGNRNRIQDIAPLRRLTQLKELSLSNNKIRDVTVLGGLQSLERLNLGHNEIAALKPLGELPKLRYVRLYSNKIGLGLENRMVLNSWLGGGVTVESSLDLRTRFGTHALIADENLELALRGAAKQVGMELTRKDLQLIRELDGRCHLIRYLHGIGHCKALVSVNLSDNPIYVDRREKLTSCDRMNIGELRTLLSLREINLSNIVQETYWTDEMWEKILSCLPESLKFLTISRNQMGRLSTYCPQLKKLRKLDASHNELFHETVLQSICSEWSGLEELDISHNGFRTIEPLLGLHHLTEVNVEHNGMYLAKGTENMTVVEELQSKGVRVKWRAGNLSKEMDHVYYTISDECIECGLCVDECPVQAISSGSGPGLRMDLQKCVGCGACAEVCSVEAIRPEGVGSNLDY